MAKLWLQQFLLRPTHFRHAIQPAPTISYLGLHVNDHSGAVNRLVLPVNCKAWCAERPQVRRIGLLGEIGHRWFQNLTRRGTLTSAHCPDLESGPDGTDQSADTGRRSDGSLWADRTLRVFVVAGEPSGDSIGGRLMASLRRLCAPFNVEFSGVGGVHMQRQGLASLFAMEDLAVMGLAEVLPRLPRIIWRVHQTVQAALSFRPDVVVTIDAKGFSFRVLRGVRAAHTRAASPPPLCVHYVAPSFWAYKGGERRLGSLSRLVDHMLCILPFEPATCRTHGIPATFVGHPALEDAFDPGGSKAAGASGFSRGEDEQIEWRVRGDGAGFRKRHGIPLREDGGGPVLCVLLGSRPQEVRRMLPIFGNAVGILARQFPGLAVVVPTAPSVQLQPLVRLHTDTWQRHLARSPVVMESSDARVMFDALAASDAALAVSGTVVTQLLLARVPCVVAYRAHPITELVARQVAAVRYTSLANIILDKEAVPEFLFSNATPAKLASAVSWLLTEPQCRYEQTVSAETVLAKLSPPRPSLYLPRGPLATSPHLTNQKEAKGGDESNEKLLSGGSSVEDHQSAWPPSMVSSRVILKCLRERCAVNAT